MGHIKVYFATHVCLTRFHKLLYSLSKPDWKHNLQHYKRKIFPLFAVSIHKKLQHQFSENLIFFELSKYFAHS